MSLFNPADSLFGPSLQTCFCTVQPTNLFLNAKDPRAFQRYCRSQVEVDSMLITAFIKNYFCVNMLQYVDDINMNSVSI